MVGQTNLRSPVPTNDHFAGRYKRSQFESVCEFFTIEELGERTILAIERKDPRSYNVPHFLQNGNIEPISRGSRDIVA
jgi:hypothetical protein